jgi:hypothetical protein
VSFIPRWMLMYFFAGFFFFFCNLTLCMTKLNLGFRLIKPKELWNHLFRRDVLVMEFLRYFCDWKFN